MGASSPTDARTEPQSPSSSAADGSRPSTPLSVDARVPRSSRLLSAPHGDSTAQASVDLVSIMASSSHPVSPGLPTPPLPPSRIQDFFPPTRPSSTPFPQPDQRTNDLQYHGCPGDNHHAVGIMNGEGAAGNAVSRCIVGLKAAHPVDLANEKDDHDSSGLLSLVTSDAAIKSEAVANLDSAMPPTPALSPISTVATSLSSPGPEFDLYLDFPHHHGLGKQKASLSPTLSVPRHHSHAPAPVAAVTPAAPLSDHTCRTLLLQNLPVEIQEYILDLVFDCKISPMARSRPSKPLAKLATFTRLWRTLIQARLYARIKLKATGLTLSDALIHFAQHPHLRSYVRHVELWFPVFEPKMAASASASAYPDGGLGSASSPAMAMDMAMAMAVDDGVLTTIYNTPSDNCSLEEAFYFLGTTFPELTVLTIEGGERRKAPQIRHFMRGGGGDGGIDDAGSASDNGESSSRPTASAVARIPPIPTVRTLICKGQWNLIRSARDFENIAAALPNLHEWQASYSKPKSKSYLTMATILPGLTTHLAHLTSLDLCLEGDYRQEISFPPYCLKVMRQVHFCGALAEATPALQHLSYTGRVCRAFFDVAARLADPRTTRLRSVDLTIKNCCRHVTHWHESGSGATDLNFIRAFESLVLAAVRSLDRLIELQHLRIRYVDLEFPVPPLNPFFLLQDGWASGVWSDTIVAELNRVRPTVRWEELSESIGERTLSKDGRLIINAEFPKKRVVSLKLSNYAFLVALATM